MSVKRWEDDTSLWHGPHYGDHALSYDEGVTSAPVAGRIITCVDVVDWDGDGGRDLLLSSWDACYDGRVHLRRQVGTRADGTPLLGAEELVPDVRGYVTAVPDGDRFHLVSASRMRKEIYLFPNIGAPGAPRFGEPVVLDLEADWVKGNEYRHMARFHDIDGDGVAELLVGTDNWDDYWPNGLEWNDEGYRAYDSAGRYLGGPLRGFLYAFRNEGTPANPVLARGRPLAAGDVPLEVYGQLAPAFGDLAGDGGNFVVCGEFWPLLHIARQAGPDGFEPPRLVARPDGTPLRLDHCIHLPCIADWDGDGRPDILVGAEDGYVTWLRNVGDGADGYPVFEAMGRIETSRPLVHAGVLPSPAAHDFGGNGRPDLVVGNSAGELLFYANLGPADAPGLGREHHLTAGGEPVRIAAGLPGSIQGPSEIMFGYTCPTVADWDGDGHPDILLGDVSGHHTFLRNTGDGSYPPTFEPARHLTFEGRRLRTVWRVKPAVVDWQGDGRLRYMTLDEEGRLADYRRVDDTALDDKRLLTFEDGEPVRFTVDVGGGRGRVKLNACDWEGDGRIGLVFGTHARACVPPTPQGAPRATTGQAGIFFMRNIGTNAEPVFAHPRHIRFRGEPIAMAMHVAAPEVVDWDGGGEQGLLVGVEDGSLVWLPRADLSW